MRGPKDILSLWMLTPDVQPMSTELNSSIHFSSYSHMLLLFYFTPGIHANRRDELVVFTGMPYTGGNVPQTLCFPGLCGAFA